MLRRSILLTGLVTGFAICLAGSASAATVKYHAAMTPGAEVPPTNSTGTGEATVALDTATHEITWDVTFSGFASDVTMAHIHGPAEAGKNAGVVVPLGNEPKSPLHGSAKLTAAQEHDLQSGLMYVNVHTKNHPAGAIRGQLMQVK
jgi:CHRD domain